MTGSLDRLAAALSDRYALERELGTGGIATPMCRTGGRSMTDAPR